MIGNSPWLATLFILPGLGWGYPSSMDIGTFAIDDYAGNGGGLSSLSFQIASGQNFFTAARNQVQGYSTATAPAGMGTHVPDLALDRRNTAVTKAAITSTSKSYGNREYCDFLFYGGHGMVGGLYLGAGGGYGTVAANEFNLGIGYNRWFLANGCSLFNTVAPPATAWKPAFQGMKAMLSFKSVVYDNNLSWELYNDFWTNWTYREESLFNAFFDAQTNYGYKHLYPTKGLEPGCLSAQPEVGHPDYCFESFRYVSHDYGRAALNTGYFYTRKIGSPEY